MAAIVLAAATSSAASSIGAGAFAAALAGGVGGYLGGFIDRSIFGRKARINQEGSRLTDLMVQASTYGKSIPVVYGNARIAGNVIWSRPIQEHVTTTTQSSAVVKVVAVAEVWKLPPRPTPTRQAWQWRSVKVRSAKWCAYGRMQSSLT